ncbi:predicted protein [Sclerotinia sclerotiorum 1980 UF-70]|uniref:Uncharacterized protein n=1 Tax=Sclerotinia sclerotiorum (strain ATCC 18683 / 1980 / Ss-1) TaxID=665079 RepID=A7E568_SCLS1|nr:predicted protein [Sclerotinia sclerotiorum 1980 UF-70]EDN91040.1 predicted protein [Sclerotinia sclerotiorum 1980 UF-70]
MSLRIMYSRSLVLKYSSNFSAANPHDLFILGFLMPRIGLDVPSSFYLPVSGTMLSLFIPVSAGVMSLFLKVEKRERGGDEYWRILGFEDGEDGSLYPLDGLPFSRQLPYPSKEGRPDNAQTSGYSRQARLSFVAIKRSTLADRTGQNDGPPPGCWRHFYSQTI